MEMETDDDHAIMREERFSLVQCIVFTDCTEALLAHRYENTVVNPRETMQFGLFIDSEYWTELLVSLNVPLIFTSTKNK